MPLDMREFFTRWIKALNELDYDALEQLVHPDFIADYPQSGERVRGFAALRTQLENYPGGLQSDSTDITHARIVDDDQRWAITPAYTVVPLAQAGRYTTIVRTTYPDGSRWWIVTIVQLREDKVYRAESYFAPEFPAPEWRKGMVELAPRD